MNIYDLLKESRVEKDVEEKYRVILREYFPTCSISSPYRTDGYLVVPELDLTMLMEIKHDLDFSKRFDIVNVLIQLIYYLKQFESHGDELPKILFGGDINECFCLHSNITIPYLNENLDWTIQPSIAHTKNPVLSKKIYDDQNIKPYVHSISDRNFNFGNVVLKINQINQGITQKVRITELNINRYFNYFMERVIKLNKKKHTPDDAVSIFLGCLTDSSNNYPHPAKKNRLVTQTFGELIIDKNNYDSFFGHFENHYSVEEKKRLTSICDRLIEDETRRFGGEFYTPTEWVNEAHKMIEEQFGLDWKEKYVVWDPAWGTGNLTRDYHFKNLYCSTINHGDLQTAQHYNPEAKKKFQYDFLNDDLEFNNLLLVDLVKKMPVELTKAFKENNPIIILMNPPFGKSSGNFMGNTKAKKGLADNPINKIMSNEKYGNASAQLYAQFLVRLIKMKEHYNLSNLNLAFFSPTLFLTGSSYKKLRYNFLSNFNFLKGMIFNSGYFSNISNNWAIGFSIFMSGNNESQFLYDIKELDLNYNIKTIFQKSLYNLDSIKRGCDWVKELDIKNLRFDCPQMSSSINIKNDGGGRWCESAIGYLINNSNSIYTNETLVSLFTSGYCRNSLGFPFTSNSFVRVVSFFTARKTISSNWINQKDEYMAPNEQHPEYFQWNVDAIIYSLFNGSSNQSSLRQITYKNKLWDIKNEWFWMPKSQMELLSNEHSFDEMYHDLTGHDERFVYTVINKINVAEGKQFSPDAMTVLNKAIELVIKSFPYRQQLHEEYPEWHLHAWDAGWYQIKKILNIYLIDDLKEFNMLYKKFEDRMREGVYKFGFLK